ncbi:MAG: aldo/keto reductase, partial [Syntrophaceae bacterium]
PKAFLYLYSPVMTDANWGRLGKLEIFARDRGHKVAALAIAWLLSHPWLSTVIAGATKPEQLDANLIGAGWKLTPEEVAQVEQI